jgi:tRNA(Ile)-lysidine synthase
VPAAEPPTQPFTDDEIDKLFAAVADEAHLAIAVSGGSDSTALMRLAHRWRLSSPPPSGGQGRVREITALTVDHGLRAESAAETETVRAWAKALGLDHAILNWEGAKPSTGIQAAARAARYRLMGDWCRAHGAKVLLVAHTIDDQAETVLMRLKRGAGVEGLGGMERFTRHGDITVFRPLIAISRQRLRAFLDAVGQHWLEDPSNENERFERVRVRKALARSEITAEAIALTAARSRRAFDAVLAITCRFLDGAVRHHEEGFGEIDLGSLLAQPEDIRIRALSSLVGRYGDHCFTELSQAESLSQWVDCGEGQARTLGGCRIARRTASLLFGREPGRIRPEPVAMPQSGRLRWDNRFDIEVLGPHAGMAIAPAGIAGKVERRRDLPAFVQASLPAVLVGGRLAAIPNLGLRTPWAPSDLSVTAAFGREPWF